MCTLACGLGGQSQISRQDIIELNMYNQQRMDLSISAMVVSVVGAIIFGLSFAFAPFLPLVITGSILLAAGLSCAIAAICRHSQYNSKLDEINRKLQGSFSCVCGC